MSKEGNLIIGTYNEEQRAFGFNPKKIGIEAVETLLRSLVVGQKPSDVFAFTQQGEVETTVYFNNEWFEETRKLHEPQQVDRVDTCTVNIMLANRCIVVIRTPLGT